MHPTTQYASKNLTKILGIDTSASIYRMKNNKIEQAKRRKNTYGKYLFCL